MCEGVYVMCPRRQRSVLNPLNLSWGTAPYFQFSYHYNSATDCSILINLGADFEHVTADTLFKVKGLEVKVTWQMHTTRRNTYII